MKVTELTQSLEFTQNEVSDLKHQVKHLEEEKNNKDKVIKNLNEDLLNIRRKLVNWKNAAYIKKTTVDGITCI